MTLTIYIDEFSQPSRALLCFMYDARLDFETVTIEVSQGQQRSTDFSKINPNKKVPALKDTLSDGSEFQMFESAAIMRYICDNYLPEDNHFYPRNDLILRAKIDERLTYYHKVIRPGARSFYAKVLAPLQGTADKFSIEHENKCSTIIAAKVDKVLQSNGGSFVKKGVRTLPDYLILNEIEQYTWGGLTLNHLKHLVAWMEWMVQSDGVQKAHRKYKWFMRQMEGELVNPYDINLLKQDLDEEP